MAATWEWRLRAACYGADPKLFNADEREPSVQAYATAERYCRNCPVRQACRSDCTPHDFGVIRGGIYRWRHNSGGKLRLIDLLAPSKLRDAS